MPYRWMTRFPSSLPALALAAFASLSLAISAGAQVPLPGSPARFVGSLDFHCFQVPLQHSVDIPLKLTHLNPVLKDLGLPDQDVKLRDPQELCLPIQKNDEKPPSDVLPFLRFLDLECFGIEGEPLNLPLHLDHLNPVIKALIGPSDDVIVREPQQLCVPVAKDDRFPRPEVLRLVENVDLECFRVEARQQFHATTLKLTHLNPLFATLPPYPGVIQPPLAKQLCVPVAKNGKIPPDDILRYVEWADVLCYDITADPIDRILRLTQLNPVLVDLIAPQEIGPYRSKKLCVPVAKNGKFPPA